MPYSDSPEGRHNDMSAVYEELHGLSQEFREHRDRVEERLRGIENNLAVLTTRLQSHAELHVQEQRNAALRWKHHDVQRIEDQTRSYVVVGVMSTLLAAAIGAVAWVIH